MPGMKESSRYTLNILGTALTLALFLLIPILRPAVSAHAADPGTESPKNVIVVKDYKWGSAGMGRPAIMKEITLQNKGKSDYENIAIEVDLYTANDIPMGSIRGTVRDLLLAGTEKTFYNVDFGIMSADLQNNVARVVNADVIEKGTPTQAKDLIQVKSWKWSGGQYGTEGILKEITLVNKSKENWKDIKIRVDYLGIPGPKVGVRGFTSRAVIHDVLPAMSEKTYYNINMGFRHPDAKKEDISVMSAKPISEKEVKIKTAKKEGKKAVRKKKKKTQATTDGTTAASESGTGVPESEKDLSLSERYKKKLAQQQGVETGEAPAAGEETPSAEGVEAAQAPAGETAGTGEESEETAAGEEEETTEEGEEEYEYEEEVPIPSEDIVVENFKWGGGVTGTIGMIDEITLRNISGITYTRIELVIEFYSFNSEAPMFSNRAVINEVLPAEGKKTFRNVKAGYLNAIPQEVRIDVVTAVPFGQ